MVNDKGAHVFRPDSVESTRHLEQDKSDREKYAKEFREQKQHEQELKEERFAKIAEERKKRKGNGSGGGINIEVTGGD